TDPIVANRRLVILGESLPVNAAGTAFTEGTLTFTGNTDFAGATSFTFQVRDAGGTATNAPLDADTDPTPKTATFTVTPVNDAPQGTTQTFTVLEDAADRTITA